jgi:AcrR family transcriptional regulator
MPIRAKKPQPASPADRRTRRREQTGQRLLDTAVRLFATHGYPNTTVEAITDAADVGKGTFFNYFPSKEHLVIALAQRQVGKIAAAASHIDPKLPVRDQIRAVVHQLAAGWLHSKRLIRSLLGTALSNDSLTPHLEAMLPKGRGHMLLLVQEGQRRGELRADLPAPEIARMLQQFMFGTHMVWSLHPDPDLDRWLDQALDIFWQGVATAPKPATKPRRRQR